MPLLRTVLTAAMLLGLSAGGSAAERATVNHAAGDRVQLAQSDGLTLSEAVEQVRRRYDGRIVSAETRISGNREIHYIKVLTSDGKVKTERIPGRRTRGS